MKQDRSLLYSCLFLLVVVSMTISRHVFVAGENTQIDLSKKTWLRHTLVNLLSECQRADYVKKEMIGKDVISSWIDEKNESQGVQEVGYYVIQLTDLIESIQYLDDSGSEFWVNDPICVEFDRRLHNVQLLREQVESRQFLCGVFRNIIARTKQENIENNVCADGERLIPFMSMERDFATEEQPHETEQWWREFNQWQHQRGVACQMGRILCFLRDTSFENLLDAALVCLPPEAVPFGPPGDRFCLLSQPPCTALDPLGIRP